MIVFICGEFNLWIDDSSIRSTVDLLDMTDSCNLMNIFNEPKSASCYILDLVLTDKDSNLVSDVC